MSVALTEWAFQKATGSWVAKLVLLDVVRWCDDASGACQRSQMDIAEDCGLSPRSVFNALKRLEAAGLISRERRRADGRRTVDQITVRLGG